MGKHRVLVIGAGVGGLSAAVRLAAKGFAVTILEKNATIGGKLNLWEAPHPARPHDRPFRFDTGPSLLTLPFVFQDLFAAAGADVRDRLPITKLDPIARFIWSDGTRFELRNDRDDLEEQIRAIDPRDVQGWTRLLSYGQKIWDLGAELFLFHAPEQILSPRTRDGDQEGVATRMRSAARMLSVPLRIGMFSRFASRVDRCIRSEKLREVFYQYATYTGASPFSAPGTFAVIPFAETHFGGWYIQGGMYALATSLHKLAYELGVEIRTNCAVERVLIEQSETASDSPGRKSGEFRATGVRLSDGNELRADAVICNADTIYSYRELIDPQFRAHFPDKKLDRLEPGGSGLVLLLGVDGTYPQLAHHTKFMPADYLSDLRAMFETRTVPEDPCIYVCASTRTDPTQAPDGCENLFVLCSAPALNGDGGKIDWAIEGPRYAQRIIETLETKFGLADLRKRIVVQRTISPVDLKNLYNANAGSIYGLGSSSRKDAFLRPPNRDKRIQNLYFAGGATHPGGGLPLVALSGKIVSELVAEDLLPP
ncbi:phytoene desaturase family protein [soil metagenome]